MGQIAGTHLPFFLLFFFFFFSLFPFPFRFSFFRLGNSKLDVLWYVIGIKSLFFSPPPKTSNQKEERDVARFKTHRNEKGDVDCTSEEEDEEICMRNGRRLRKLMGVCGYVWGEKIRVG